MADKAQQGVKKAKAEARVAGGALVVSFPGQPASGETPKVWRADMARLSPAAFELREDGEKTALVLKTPAAAEDIHAFADKAAAAAALQAITQALFAQNPPVTAPAAPKGGFWGRFLRTVVYILVLLVCIVVLGVFLKFKTMGPEGLLGAGGPPVREGKGVPMPADRMFGKQEDAR